MNDLIDRQEAIDRFNVIRPVDPKKDEYTKGIDVGIAMCIVAVKDQPTIQPQSTTGQLNDGAQSTARSTDLIDRQVAIRWVKTECNLYGKPTLDFESGKKVIEHLKQMPPAQPERAEGEWVLKDYLWECAKCGCRINVKNPLDCDKWSYYYCPHCGTKMLIAVQRGR